MIYSEYKGGYMFEKIKKYLMRRQSPVVFPCALRTEPVARGFGVVNGTPIDRYYIEKFLETRCDLIRGVVGEIAEDTYTTRFGRDATQSVVFHFNQDASDGICGDLTCPNQLPEHCYDCFICTQTLNFIYDVPTAIRSLSRMLKPGGILLGSVAGISQISRFDYERWGDYWRFTDLAVTRLLQSEFSAVEVEAFGNLAAATALLDGVVVEQLPDRSVLEVTDPDYQMTIGFVAVKAE